MSSDSAVTLVSYAAEVVMPELYHTGRLSSETAKILHDLEFRFKNKFNNLFHFGRFYELRDYVQFEPLFWPYTENATRSSNWYRANVIAFASLGNVAYLEKVLSGDSVFGELYLAYEVAAKMEQKQVVDFLMQRYPDERIPFLQIGVDSELQRRLVDQERQKVTSCLCNPDLTIEDLRQLRRTYQGLFSSIIVSEIIGQQPRRSEFVEIICRDISYSDAEILMTKVADEGNLDLLVAGKINFGLDSLIRILFDRQSVNIDFLLEIVHFVDPNDIHTFNTAMISAWKFGIDSVVDAILEIKPEIDFWSEDYTSRRLTERACLLRRKYGQQLAQAIYDRNFSALDELTTNPDIKYNLYLWLNLYRNAFDKINDYRHLHPKEDLTTFYVAMGAYDKVSISTTLSLNEAEILFRLVVDRGDPEGIRWIEAYSRVNKFELWSRLRSRLFTHPLIPVGERAADVKERFVNRRLL